MTIPFWKLLGRGIVISLAIYFAAQAFGATQPFDLLWPVSVFLSIVGAGPLFWKTGNIWLLTFVAVGFATIATTFSHVVYQVTLVRGIAVWSLGFLSIFIIGGITGFSLEPPIPKEDIPS